MNNLAIIPARGGSKRIPGKNTKDFLGKPIIAYSIEIALASGLFEQVMVSTDDSEIAEISLKFGAKIPFFRSSGTSGDYSTTMDVIKEVIINYKEKLGQTFNYVCCIYPTAPFIQTSHLRAGFDLMTRRKYNSVFPIVAFGYPIWRGVEMKEGGRIQMIWKEFETTRTQDFKTVFHDAGQWYWIDITKAFNSVFTPNTGSIVLTEEEVQDIDNLSDWKLAELKYRLLHEN